MALLFKLALYSDFLWLQDGFQQFKFYILLGSSITKKKERYSQAQVRKHDLEHAQSCLILEAKEGWAWLVLGWEET